MSTKKGETYICQHCGAKALKWQGQCFQCGQWGTLHPAGGEKGKTREKSAAVQVCFLDEIQGQNEGFFSSGSRILDEFLGQGLVKGACFLLAGAPGVGKSTFLLQMMSGFAAQGGKALYVSGEESLTQLKLRAERLGLDTKNLQVCSTTRIEHVLPILTRLTPPGLVILDSIQVFTSGEVDSLPGAISQVKAVTTCLLEAIRGSGLTLILVGHINKEGQIAGPKVLEHLVDGVFYLEGEQEHFFRILRSVKNRYGPTSNMLILKMSNQGLQIVSDPSTFFLQARDPKLPGTALVMALEGQKTFLVEIQALIAKSYLQLPRRYALGVDLKRINLLLAILEKKLGLRLGEMDVYVKIGGGLSLHDPGLDLGVIAALISSYYEQPLPEQAVFWGEVDLSGQVRPVVGGDLRLNQARLLQYHPVFCPYGEQDGQVQGVHRLRDIFGLHNQALMLKD